VGKFHYLQSWPFGEENHVDVLTGRKIREAILDRTPPVQLKRAPTMGSSPG